MDAPQDNHSHPRFRAGSPRHGERYRTIIDEGQLDEHHFEGMYNDYPEPRQPGLRPADWGNSHFGPRLGRPGGAALRSAGSPAFAPPRRRTMVAAIISPGMRGDRFTNHGTFTINRDLLFAHFPRAQDAARRGILDLDLFVRRAVADGHPERIIRWVLRFIFGHMERLSRTGHLDMFGAAEQQIEDALDRAPTVALWAARTHAMCVVLDQDRGLGCSDELLSRIMTFLEDLFQDVHNLLGCWQTGVLFEAFTGVFRATRWDLVEQLHRLWNRFDIDVQEHLMCGMMLAVRSSIVEGGAHRVYRALHQYSSPVGVL
ncbi:hypothetical protein BKA56DRAFT_251944 [Ilyonectria sp. MPI-CAGE-AT-0026]|nr:hypothetical protein BKA56DRAFT_251944 [Ilyonectria sp. MPI-CAGE-AT-0026]